MIHFITTVVFLLTFNTVNPTFSSSQFSNSTQETQEAPITNDDTGIINDDIMGV
jgi:hypothetical protein